MLAMRLLSECICSFCSQKLKAIWILLELFVHYHYQGSPHNRTLILSLSMCQVQKKSPSRWSKVDWCVLYDNVK